MQQLTGPQQAMRVFSGEAPAAEGQLLSQQVVQPSNEQGVPPLPSPQQLQQQQGETRLPQHHSDSTLSSTGHRASQHLEQQQMLASRQEEENAALALRQRGQQQELEVQHLAAQVALDQQQLEEAEQDRQDEQGQRERQDSLSLELEEAEQQHTERGGWQQLQQPQEEPPVAAPAGHLTAFLRDASTSATTPGHVSPCALAGPQGAADTPLAPPVQGQPQPATPPEQQAAGLPQRESASEAPAAQAREPVPGAGLRSPFDNI